MDYDLGGRYKREAEQRRKEAKRKLEQQKRDDDQRSAMERDQRAREEERLREAEEARLRAEREMRLNDGVQYVSRLRPYPSSRADDKLELPASALQELERQNALDSGTLLTFAVSALGSAGGLTHAGVAEFTAEEGTVGVPPRVALCLTKGAGLETLAGVSQVEVRYVKLPRCGKSRVKFQPRGHGFHAGGLKAIRMDLETVLQESLRGHTALTEGDWLPIRHEGITYELVVRELEPESQLALLNTDLTVEVLPSEQTEAEMKAEEERLAREEAAKREAEHQEILRLERAKAKALELGPEPAAAADVLQLLVRLPSGGRLSRRFARSTAFAKVLLWVESEPDSRVRPDEFRLVQKWPGHCRELGQAEAAETLGGLNFARQEALFLQHMNSEAADGQDSASQVVEEDVPMEQSSPLAAAAPSQATGGAWSAAEERAHEALDRRLADGPETPTAALKEGPLQEVKGQELVAVFDRLKALGMPPQDAAVASKKYAAQLRELGDMGFEDWVTAVRLLQKYNGRLMRVANLLSEGEGANDAFHMDSSPSPPSAHRDPAPAPTQAPAIAADPQTTAPKAQKTAAAPIDKQAVHAKFQELVAAGIEPNAAATQAIQLVRKEAAEAAAAAAAADAATAAATHPVANAEDDPEKLQELAMMGFTDVERNRAMLKKFAGRMERVIEALIGGS